MIFAGLIGAFGWYYLATYAHTPLEATAASIVASLGVAVSDVVADSIVVEKVSGLFGTPEQWRHILTVQRSTFAEVGFAKRVRQCACLG